MMLGAFLLAAALSQAPQSEAAREPAATASSPAVETTPAPAEARKEGEGAARGEAATSPAESGSPAHAAGAAEAHGAEGEAEGGESPAKVLMHHVMNEGSPYTFKIWDLALFTVPMSKHLFFLLVVMALVIVVARVSLASYKNSAPSGLGSAVESLVVYVRDEIAEKNIGHGDGAKYTPLLLSFFFFILFAALFGLLPFTGTSTGNLSVTFALAFISFLAQQYAGMSKYGVVGHFKNLVPHGLPAPLLIVMIPIEVLGMFTKPFALMVRLFANMLAGHMIITALLLLVPLSAKMSGVFGVAMIPVSLGMALFIMCLEILVAFIQAYVFTLFSAIFIGMYAHPSH
jgi:F-type H+-transporting ATPase subunit a